MVAATAVALVALFLVPTSMGGGHNVSTGLPGTTPAGRPNAPAAPIHLTVPKTNKYDWPELHRAPDLEGYASTSPLSSRNAPSLGVAWATNLYGAALDSPAVAYDPILGETLVYVGTENGNVLAVNLASGQIVWGLWLGSPIRSSPIVSNGSVYIVPFTIASLYKFNATTGATQCKAALPGNSESTPTIATPPGGVRTLYIGMASSGTSGPLTAINAGNCSIEWKFSKFNQPPAGEWDSVSYAVNASGGGMVLVGTDDPDSSIYAVNALTGTLLWRFQCYNPPGADDDVGAGPMVSPPGKNGIAQGAVYVTNKVGIAYALYLNNGTDFWETNFNALAGISGRAFGQVVSTPALDGTSVVFGFAYGLFDLNATDGAEMWEYQDPTVTESISSPAIAGGHGHGIVITGDVAGELDVAAMVSGTQLYSYQTGGYIAASPAVSDGNILIDSSDGFLYCFAVGGGDHSTLPTSSISSPTDGALLPNPNGNLTAYGNATDTTGVVTVEVGIQSDGEAGPWWDAATGTWSPGPIDNRATLSSPGALASAWHLSFPVPSGGDSYEVFANAVSSAGQTGIVTPSVSFAVSYSTSGPHLETSSAYVAPGGSVTVHGGGFGKSVKVTISLLNNTLATVTSAANGSLKSTLVMIPARTQFGPTELMAKSTKTGMSSGALIVVDNSWDQLGSVPGHAGFEPNDPALHQYIFPGGPNPNWLPVAWRFDAPAPINASPVVADGVAYVADAVGNLYAVDISNGGTLWNFTLASGASFDVSPAVDPSLGLVFVGAADGSLTAVHMSNGSRAWSDTIGGSVSAPIYSAGDLYVTSTTGAVESIAESSGAVAWSKTLSSAITATPALNRTVNLLYVGESNGAVVALNASTGATHWKYVTGGAVTAAPMDTQGTVYVGSNDHSLYALNQLTGALRWSFDTGGAVQDTATLDNKGFLWIGSDDGTLFVLHVSSGTEDFNWSIGSPVVGLASADGITVFTTLNGTIGAQKTFLDDAGWRYPTSAGIVTTPLILDTGVFVAGGDGFLYAFTTDGQPPD